MKRVAGKKLKIFYAIIILFLITVVDHLARMQVSPKMSLHYQPVLKNIWSVLTSEWVIWGIQFHVSILINNSTTKPVVVAFSPYRSREFLRYAVFSQECLYVTLVRANAAGNFSQWKSIVAPPKNISAILPAGTTASQSCP